MPITTTFEQDDVTYTFKNTMRNAIRFLRMKARFAPEDAPDYELLSDFCWLMAYLDTVDGAEGWKPVDETATEKQFEAAYLGFSETVDLDAFYETVRAVNQMKRRDDPVEKPDSALTAEEKNDPN
jgi:hypothetical protein